MKRNLWIYALLLLLFSGILYAQIDSRGLKVKLRSQAGKRWAICIGIDKYVDKKLNALKKASNDAYGLGDILKGNGDFDVSVFSDKDKNGNEQSFSSNFFPTKRNIENHLSNMIEMGDIKSTDLVVFSFSGHGISDAKGNGYLLPLDWDSGKANESAIPVSTIVTWLKRTGVTKSLVLIDACREEMSPTRSVDTMKRLYEEKFQSANVSAIFFATKQGGFSYEDPGSNYGAFTKFLISGLRGFGDLDRNGLVTFRELSTFVEDSLSVWARNNGYKQRPYIGPIGEQSGDLALTISNLSTVKPEPPTPKKEPEIVTQGEIRQTIKGQYGDFVLEMVSIPVGEFMMGSDDGESDDEKPVHLIKLDAFYLGKYEVTQKEWQAVMGNNPSNWKGDDLPVENVSWNDVQEYLQKLNSITDKRWRLPTEAEWEYACRAGSTTKYCFGDNTSQLGEYAWFDDNSGNKTHPVGQKKSNAWGLYDMHGNVWEWCQDWYDKNYYVSSPVTNPTGPSSGQYRVVRGGSRFLDDINELSANRSALSLGDRRSSVGFRCLQEP